MTHVYEGEPDARQAGDIKPSRFRPRYRALSDAEIALHDAIKAKAAELEALFEQAHKLRFPTPEILQPIDPNEPIELTIGCIGEVDPAYGYFDKGMDALELAVMWTVKGLTSSPPDAA